MGVPRPLAKIFLPLAIKALERHGPTFLENLASNPTEAQKYCAVCGERIQGGAEFLASRRFICRKCGHRTHYHCAANAAERLCKACHKRRRSCLDWLLRRNNV